MKHIYAPIRSVGETLDGVVVIELVDTDGRPAHLAIRFQSFRNREIDGDHLYRDGMEAAKAGLERSFGISLREWRPLTTEEAEAVEGLIG